jgi:hypothetical protein
MMAHFTLASAQIAAMKPLKQITVAAWCVEIVAFAALGIYWWRAPMADLRILASGFFLTIFVKSVVQTLRVRQVRLIKVEANRGHYWFWLGAKSALMAIGIYIICCRW